MIIKPELLARLNEQIGNEFSAMLQYYSIGAHFERETLPMLAGHYHRQAELEEVSSAQDLLSVVQRAGEGNLLRVEEYLAREGGKVSGFRSSSTSKGD